MTTATRWTEDVKAYPLEQVAGLLGLVAGRGRSLSPCPACGADRRGSGDSRGPVGVTRDGQGWRCHRCSAAGDAVTLAGLVLLGREPRAPKDWQQVRQWCAEQRLCEPDAKSQLAGTQAPAPRRPAPAPRPPEPPKRPPFGEVLELWNASVGVDEDPEALAYLEGRGLGGPRLWHLVWRDLVRALPLGRTLPPWARFRGRPWNVTGHRLVTRMWSAAGRCESLHARNLRPDCPPGEKAAAASGASLAGLVFADSLGVQVLEQGAAPDWWKGPLAVLVTEGEPDFWTWGTHYGDAAEDAPALLGVVEGSWNPEVASRLPAGSRVCLGTDADKKGESYAARVAGTLQGRCELLRWTP